MSTTRTVRTKPETNWSKWYRITKREDYLLDELSAIITDENDDPLIVYGDSGYLLVPATERTARALI